MKCKKCLLCIPQKKEAFLENKLPTNRICSLTSAILDKSNFAIQRMTTNFNLETFEKKIDIKITSKSLFENRFLRSCSRYHEKLG